VVPVASDHEATTAQIVIAWTLQQPGITFALCGARNPDQAIENAKAGQIRLSAEDLGQIDSAARRHLVELDR
jgi:aryl-alcohol dehydrogenase-like predicted oxidoreductase